MERSVLTRRAFLAAGAAGLGGCARKQRLLVVPVRIILDAKVKWRPERLEKFWRHIWPQAVREFGRCGIVLKDTLGQGEMQRPPNREPVLTGLDRGSLNLVVTDRLPLEWDLGRALGGVTTRYRGYHVCVLAWAFAHTNQAPFFSLNTCVHEMLHALMMDIYETRPRGVPGGAREFRIDWYATLLWMGEGRDAVRRSTEVYLQRLSADAARLGA